jgi:hypothetical protein
MANLLYANNAVGTLAAAITNVSTSITLNAGQAALFPNPSAPQVFYATLTDAATQTLKEIVEVTAVSGNIFSVVRAQDGTAALSWNAGDFIEQCAIRLEMQGWENAAEGLFGAQGVAVTPSTTLGIVGTTGADNANAGAVGEFMSASASGLAMTNGVTRNLVSLTLTPGDWEVQATIGYTETGGTTMTNILGGVSSASATFQGLGTFWQIDIPFSTGGVAFFPTPTVRFNVSVNTPIFAVGDANFSGGSLSGSASIRARRVR